MVFCLFVFGFVVVIIIQDVPFDFNVCVIVVHFTMNGGLSFIYYYFIYLFVYQSGGKV